MKKEIYVTLEKMRLKFYTLVEKPNRNTYILKSHSDEELYIYNNKEGTIVKGRRIYIVLDKYMPVIADGEKLEIGFIMRADSKIIKYNMINTILEKQEDRAVLENINEAKKKYNEVMSDKKAHIITKLSAVWYMFEMKRISWKELNIIC